jgi:hypothetical protein
MDRQDSAEAPETTDNHAQKPPVKPKRQLTEAQLAVLEKAREKARQSKLIKSKEKDEEKALKEKEAKLAKMEREKKTAELEKKLKQYEGSDDDEEEQRPVKQTKRPPAASKKRVRIDEPRRDSDDDMGEPPVHDVRTIQAMKEQQSLAEKAAYKAEMERLRHEMVYKNMIGYL